MMFMHRDDQEELANASLALQERISSAQCDNLRKESRPLVVEMLDGRDCLNKGEEYDVT